jgi:hypothetical protein
VKESKQGGGLGIRMCPLYMAVYCNDYPCIEYDTTKRYYVFNMTTLVVKKVAEIGNEKNVWDDAAGKCQQSADRQ